MDLVLLGTAGGPTPKRTRSAPAQAIVTGGGTYIVDCGNGVARQLVRADIPFDTMRAVFITHHHSDHVADYGNLFLLAWATNWSRHVDAYGPPPLRTMTERYLDLYEVDIATRIADEGRPPLRPLITVHERTSAGVVHIDDNVRVTAAVVEHPPIAPAFAYRFDTDERSIVISGDTTLCPQLIDLAHDADVLVHEVIYPPAIDAIVARSNGRTLRQHLVNSHTSVEDVGKVAQAARVRTLVLSHLVPSDGQVSDERWHELASRGYDGEVIVGRDLMRI